MATHSSRSSKKRRRTLFARIAGALTLPLLGLIVLFTAIQLAGAMQNINQSYQLKSQFAFETVHRTLQLALQNKRQVNAESLSGILRELTELHDGMRIHVFDLLERRIIGDASAAWETFDEQGLEASLLHRQDGKSYYVRVQKERKELVAFIPLENSERNITYVVRARFPLANIGEALKYSRWMLLLMITLIIVTGAFIGRQLSASIVKPILVLNDATREIVQGNLGKHVRIATGDEIEDLAKTFNEMSDSLAEMKKKAQDANPLTGLPGNQGIFHEVKKRIHERQKFVLFHTDLDRFKVFNDHFGLGKGDEAIVKTAELLKKAVREKGDKDDFIGHQGGDDFVIVTKPHKAAELAEYVTSSFSEAVAKALYPKEDFERGYTMQLDRRRLAETGEEIMTKFPLLALSLAGVSNAKKDFADYFDCMSAAVSVKKEVKAVIESSYKIKE